MLTYRVEGEGTPLLLLNGGLMTIRSWQPVVDALAGSRQIVRCDFRGQLLLPEPFATSLEEHVSDVVELLDHLAIDAAEVAGVSFGAEVAMLLAAQHPQRVRRLAIFSATAKTDDVMRRDAFEGRRLAEEAAAGRSDGTQFFRRLFEGTWSAPFLARNPGFIEKRLSEVSLIPPNFYEGAAAIIRILDDLDLTPYLPAITAPTVVAVGELDRIFPPVNSREIADAIPGARLEIVPGTGHGLLFERMDRCVELIRGL